MRITKFWGTMCSPSGMRNADRTLQAILKGAFS